MSSLDASNRATFSLLGAGYYGVNGVGPCVASFQYKAYVVPTLLYGVEAIVPNTDDLKRLDQAHKKSLRRMQGLPDSTAIPGLYLLIGIPTIEALIHIRALCLFRSIIAAEKPSPPSIFIKELIQRQLAMKDNSSHSWAAYIRKLLQRYQLPNPSTLISDVPTKKKWAKVVKTAVNDHWLKTLVEEAKCKKSMSFLNAEKCSLSDTHPVWHDLHCPLDVMKATVKAKMLLQRYPLLTSHTARNQRSETCMLCKQEPETTSHFLLHCPALQKERNIYMPRILNTCRCQNISIGSEQVTKIILDSNHLNHPDRSHEITCRNMIYKLHTRRANLLGSETRYKSRT